MSLSATLRGHSNGVGALKFVGQFLYSGGSDGMIFQWDLISRRAHRSWQGHTSTVVLLEFFEFKGISVLVSHSRDASIKFWDVSSTLEDVPIHTEMPVNALNFCNVSLLVDSLLLISPATVDLDHFDIYHLRSIFPLQFDRIVNNVDPLELLKRLVVVDESSGQRGGLGIMMRCVWVQDNTKHPDVTDDYRFAIGYESGAVLAFSLRLPDASIVRRASKSGSSVSIVNKAALVAVDYFSDILSPSPIVSLQYSPTNDTILAGSSGKKLAYLSYTKISMEKDMPEDNVRSDMDSLGDYVIGDVGVVSLKYGGIGALSVLNSTMAVAFWNGVVRGFDVSTLGTDNDRIWHLERALPMVDSLKDSTWKPTALAQRGHDVTGENGFQQTKKTDGTTGLEGTIARSRGREGSRTMIRSKRSLLAKDILAIGYENGSIALYEV